MIFDYAMAVALGKKVIYLGPPEKPLELRTAEFIASSLPVFLGYPVAIKKIPLRWRNKGPARWISIAAFGIAFALNKKIEFGNPEAIKQTPHKSFENVLLALIGNL